MPGGYRPGTQGDLGWLFDELDSIKRRLSSVESPDSSQRNLTLDELARAFAEMPVPLRNIDRRGGDALASGWTTVASTSVVVPEGRPLARVLALGDAAFLDVTSGGLTSSDARILIRSSDPDIADVTSGSFPAAKDGAASVVNNVLRATFAGNYDRPAGSAIEALMQVQPLNPAAFTAQPGNFGQIVLDVNFTPAGIL